MDEKEQLSIIEDTKAEARATDSEKLIEERKKKLAGFFKKSSIWVVGLLIIAIILGVYIRSLPMQDHGGKPGLWDITTNTWTLGPDLDPWLFERSAETIIKTGTLPARDYMRNVPLGFDNTLESRLLPYMIVGLYYFLNLFMKASPIFSAVLFPVVMFALTILSFFIFVREIFNGESKKDKTKANLIAIISTFFMIVIPAFLSRTVAGIPEKESAAFFFMFLVFYFILKAWKSKKAKIYVPLGILSGVFTALMWLIWGGVIYIFISIAVATMIAFILNKIERKEVITYSLWLFISIIIFISFSTRINLSDILTSLDSGLAFLVFLIIVIHMILWKTGLSEIKYLKQSKIPKNVISIIIGMVLIIIFVLIFLGPGFIIEKLQAINQYLFTPTTGRWNITVAENRQPYFTEWAASFGPFIKNIPILFWLFFIGSVMLFRRMLDKINKKDAWILTGFYVLFFVGLVFSRYAPHPNVFDGEGFVSRAFYYVSALLLIGSLGYYYWIYDRRNDKRFESIKYDYLLLFALFVFCLFTARGAVRLIMVLATIAPIFLGYLVVEMFYIFSKTKDETAKIIVGAIFVFILFLSCFIFWNFYKEVKNEAYYFIPSGYNYQWQKAMQWVREDTPIDAVFAHWWDYGYWLQSIGNRATVTDGGNAIAYWNYLMGRHVLTGDNQKDALDFLYSHNASYLLIDSSDIGKYTAFSSIGSDINYDRYSWIGTFLQDEKQVQETKNQTLYVYTGGIALDEDLIINQSGKEVILPGGGAGVGAIILPLDKKTNKFGQPYIVTVFQGSQYKVNLRYLAMDKEFMDFKEGIPACAYLFPSLENQGQGVKSNQIGAAMFISPRLLRGLLAQIYILNDPFKKFQNFNLTHTESSLVVENLRSQGMNLPEFIYYQGVQGPIKIWEIKYTGKEEIKKEYLDTDPSKYLSWQL
jgi:asparagine N-glycosylation enzyme membrane subunit Stt3